MDCSIVYYNIIPFCSWEQLFTYRCINKKFYKFCTDNTINQQNTLIKKIMKKLNILGTTYHGNDGLTYWIGGCDYCNDDEDLNAINKLLSKGHIAIKNYKIITKDIFCKVIRHINKHGINFNKKSMDRLMTIKVPFEKVTIMYRTNTWYGKLNEWYNSDIYTVDDKLLGLKSRKYIKIIERFMSVEINANVKGAAITLDDILFATRGLMVDGSRTIDSYEIVEIKNNKLILEPEIDNFST